jgi:hypothetical protein
VIKHSVAGSFGPFASDEYEPNVILNTATTTSAKAAVTAGERLKFFLMVALLRPNGLPAKNTRETRIPYVGSLSRLPLTVNTDCTP